LRAIVAESGLTLRTVRTIVARKAPIGPPGRPRSFAD